MGFPIIRHYTRNELEVIANQIVGERLPSRQVQEITTITAAQNYAIGAKKDLDQSRYRYGQAGAVGLALGVLCQAPVPPAAHHDLIPLASYAIGTKVVTLTLGATGVALNEMAGGWLFVNDGTGQGQCLRILSHPAAIGTATCVFTLIDPVTTAFNIADTLCALVANPYDAAIIHPSPPTAQLVGVPVVAITANWFGWFKTRGPAAVLTQGTLYIHRQVRPSATVDGAVAHASLDVTAGATTGVEHANGTLALNSAGADSAVSLSGPAAAAPAAGVHELGPLATIIGRVMRVEVDTDYSLIDLCLE